MKSWDEGMCRGGVKMNENVKERREGREEGLEARGGRFEGR